MLSPDIPMRILILMNGVYGLDYLIKDVPDHFLANHLSLDESLEIACVWLGHKDKGGLIAEDLLYLKEVLLEDKLLSILEDLLVEV